jgi:hypothetical protein
MLVLKGKRGGERKKKVGLVMVTRVITQVHVGQRNNIHHWMWQSCIPNQESRWLQP